MNREKTCIHTTKTECDVTNMLKNVRDNYIARIYSEVPEEEDNYNTPPYEVSPSFIPYEQSKQEMLLLYICASICLPPCQSPTQYKGVCVQVETKRVPS